MAAIALAALLSAVALRVAARPDPAPIPPPLGGEPASATCTTWITSLVRGFQGDFTPEAASTIYTSTDTVYDQVPCGGCALGLTTALAPFWGGAGPVVQITGTVTAAEPAKLTSTICAPEATPHHGQVPGPGTGRGADERDAAPEECTTTITRPNVPWWRTANLDGTSTVYVSTSTALESVQCGGCALALTTAVGIPGGHGPVVHNTATLTQTTPTVVTSIVCASSTA